MSKNTEFKNTLKGLAFLTPNIIGFLTFTIFPLGFSLVMTFSNWDLSQHNMFKDEPLQWVLLENYVDLLSNPDFWRYLGNTLFFMMGIPLSIAGSLCAAILLNKAVGAKASEGKVKMVVSGLIVTTLVCAFMLGFKTSLITVLITALFGLIYVGGMAGGSSVYRTLFYMPHFTAGIATFILWKKLYNPQTGPLTNALQPILDLLNPVVNFLGEDFIHLFMYLALVGIAGLCYLGFIKFHKWRDDGDLGYIGLLVGCFFVIFPSGFILRWIEHPIGSQLLQMMTIAVILMFISKFINQKLDEPIYPDKGLGNAIVLGLLLMVGQFVLIGLSNVFYTLPEMAKVGIESPSLLTEYNWAKPSIMFMGFWASIGSNQMLLFLAALANVSPELTEAAEIDGANRFQIFWNVTWPQLAPVTFFITVMAIINGMQGGFETAQVMTGGGPAGATTTLEFFIYQEGFESGRLAYASTVSWVLFAMIFVVTLFNWRFGNRYTND